MQHRLLPLTFMAATLASLVCWQIKGNADEITPPPDSNKPATAPTATRGGANCSSGENSLTAIAPNGGLVTTSADYPALLFYIPETTAKEAEFVIIDGEGNFIYNAKLTLPRKPGIMRLNLPPETASPITETGNPYQWELALICDESDRSGDDLVVGELQRVPVSLEIQNKLQQANSADRFSLYQEAGLEYEAIAALDELRRENPQDERLQSAWEQWLKERGLEDLVGMPAIGD